MKHYAILLLLSLLSLSCKSDKVTNNDDQQGIFLDRIVYRDDSQPEDYFFSVVTTAEIHDINGVFKLVNPQYLTVGSGPSLSTKGNLISYINPVNDIFPSLMNSDGSDPHVLDVLYQQRANYLRISPDEKKMAFVKIENSIF